MRQLGSRLKSSRTTIPRPQQLILVQQIAEQYWRLLRARRVETDALNRHAAQMAQEQRSGKYVIQHDLEQERISFALNLAAVFSWHGAEVDRHYKTAIERAYHLLIRSQRYRALQRKKNSRLPLL